MPGHSIWAIYLSPMIWIRWTSVKVHRRWKPNFFTTKILKTKTFRKPRPRFVWTLTSNLQETFLWNKPTNVREVAFWKCPFRKFGKYTVYLTTPPPSPPWPVALSFTSSYYPLWYKAYFRFSKTNGKRKFKKCATWYIGTHIGNLCKNFGK